MTYYGHPICQRCGGVLPGSCVCDLPALRSLEKAMDEHCACRGEAHDECREEEEEMDELELVEKFGRMLCELQDGPEAQAVPKFLRNMLESVEDEYRVWLRGKYGNAVADRNAR